MTCTRKLPRFAPPREGGTLDASLLAKIGLWAKLTLVPYSVKPL